MDIKVSFEKVRVPVTVLQVDGNIDAATYEMFQSKAAELIKGGTRYLLVDLTSVPFVSSAGLRAFNEIFNQLRKFSPDQNDEKVRKGIRDGTYKSPYLKLLNPSREAMATFETSGLVMYIEVYQDRKTALASF